MSIGGLGPGEGSRRDLRRRQPHRRLVSPKHQLPLVLPIVPSLIVIGPSGVKDAPFAVHFGNGLRKVAVRPASTVRRIQLVRIKDDALSIACAFANRRRRFPDTPNPRMTQLFLG